MKKSQIVLLIILGFYITAGLFAAVFYYRNGSLLSLQINPRKALISSVVGNVIIPEQEEEPEPAPAEPAEEPAPEPEPAAPERKYYKATVATKYQRLHVRRSPSLTGEILGKMEKGTTAYVIEPGEKWSLITTGTVTGYSYNDYLDMVEIPLEEFPPEYLEPPYPNWD